MGQRSNTFEEGDSSSVATERECLQTKKKTARFYVIKSKKTLTVLTRVVFLILTLFSAGVITTSIWLMMDCRENFATVRPILPRNIQFCTNMGMPALFACCTVLFAIFGLGCTGRRLTGYALIIISCVEILQSVTALTFYKCNTMSRQEIVRSVNSSLLPCYSPSMSVVPFTYRYPADNTAPISDMSSINNLHRSNRNTDKILSSKIGLNNDGNKYPATELKHLLILPTEENNLLPQLPRMPTNYFQHAKTKLLHGEDIQVPLGSPHLGHTIKVFSKAGKRDNVKRASEKTPQVFQHTPDCSPESRYFWNLSQRLKKSEVSSCVQICKAYQIVCVAATNSIKYAARVPPSDYILQGGILQEGMDTSKDWLKGPVQQSVSKSSKTVLPSNKDINGYENKAEECGYMVYKYVSDLCYYDNKVILPISLCAPLLCIGMSACFIYFAYCDRKLKEDTQSNIIIQATETSSSSCADSLRELGSNLKSCSRTCISCCQSIWARVVSCWYCTVRSGSLGSESSTSTHELLHLRAMPSNASDGGTISPAISQYTINTIFSDDSSPPLPRRS